MSVYENYEVASKYYDTYRIPAGADFLSAILTVYAKKQLSEIHLLDAGCGTGNYSKAFLDYGVGKVTMLDASQGMLVKAREKLSPYLSSGKVGSIVHHHLPFLPFGNEEFDVVTLIQVAHHIDIPNTGFPNLRKVVQSAYRVMKPGGVLLVNYCTHEQLMCSSWSAALLPKTSRDFARRVASQGDLFDIVRDAGFVNLAQYVQYEESYLKGGSAEMPANGIRDETWRKLDSIWKHAEETGEDEEAFQKYDDLLRNGKFDSFIKEYKLNAEKVGRTTTLFAQKMV